MIKSAILFVFVIYFSRCTALDFGEACYRVALQNMTLPNKEKTVFRFKNSCEVKFVDNFIDVKHMETGMNSEFDLHNLSEDFPIYDSKNMEEVRLRYNTILESEVVCLGSFNSMYYCLVAMSEYFLHENGTINYQQALSTVLVAIALDKNLEVTRKEVWRIE